MDSKNAVNLNLSKKVQNKSNVRRYFPYDVEFIDEKLLYQLIGMDVIVGNKRGLSFKKTDDDYHGFDDEYGDRY